VRRSGDTVHVAELHHGQHLSANGPGGRILEMLDDEMTPRAIAMALMNEFEVDGERAETELLVFLAELVGSGIAVVEG
jgi:hypothetical protein